MDETRQPGIIFAQIYLSEVQFQHRSDALQLPPDSKFPDLSFDVALQVFTADEGRVAALKFRVSSQPRDESQYSVSVEVTAIVQSIEGQENMPPQEYVRHFAPAALYPFVREAIANLTMRGRFGPVFLKPINFTVLKPAPASTTNG